MTPAAFLGVQLADSRWWGPLASIITQANFYNKSPRIHIYIHLLALFPGEP